MTLRASPLRFLVAALAVGSLALFALPTSAAPQRQVTIHGAETGAHLRLGMRHGRLVVRGWMAPRAQEGCRYRKYRRVAVCSLRGMDRIVLRMGGSSDRVHVVAPLPLPLVAYLGGGSDKLLGNAEKDFCYPQGSKRNRCELGPGDDVCITGYKNSDCVGGAGDDYCRHYAGSDGCWGGPGDDVCVMGGGHDGCHGDAGNDRLFGGPSSDQLYGGRGYDYCDGGPGRGHSHSCEAGPGH